MITINRLLFVAISCSVLYACFVSWDSSQTSTARIDDGIHQLTLRPARVAFHGGTSFDCDGVRYQLLGIKDSDDPDKRKKAEVETRYWFAAAGNVLTIMNGSRPWPTKDDVRLIWVLPGKADNGGGGCLNVRLMEKGLVEFDISPNEYYSFWEMWKEGPHECPWQDYLQAAKDASEKGKQR